MRSFAKHFPLIAFLFLLSFATPARAAEVVSTSKSRVRAVASAKGFFLQAVGSLEEGPGDLAPPQLFQIVRPDDRPLTIGRLYTSCVCVRLEADQTTFAPGETAILRLRNVAATPQSGQNYAVYVQINSPIRTVLRIDTFMQSSQFLNPPPAPTPVQAVAAGGGERSGARPVGVIVSTEGGDPVFQAAEGVTTEAPAAPVHIPEVTEAPEVTDVPEATEVPAVPETVETPAAPEEAKANDEAFGSKYEEFRADAGMGSKYDAVIDDGEDDEAGSKYDDFVVDEEWNDKAFESKYDDAPASEPRNFFGRAADAASRTASTVREKATRAEEVVSEKAKSAGSAIADTARTAANRTSNAYRALTGAEEAEGGQ